MNQADVMLSAVRSQIELWEQAEGGSRAEFEAAEAFTRAFAELDAHLKDGGEMPGGWPALPANVCVVRAQDLENMLPRVEKQQSLLPHEKASAERLREIADEARNRT